MSNPQPRFDWSAPVARERPALPVAQSDHAIATHHSAMAAEAASKTRVSKAQELREIYAAAGDKGKSDWDVFYEKGWLMSTICGARNSIKGELWPADREGLSPSGNAVTCWRLATPAEVESKKLAVQSALPASSTEERK
ncbi:MAG: hypothetical protein Q8T13_23840 [Acidobacteriota bacterium]|nr:hypothetical protein [Acidobacteriota bacterium]